MVHTAHLMQVLLGDWSWSFNEDNVAEDVIFVTVVGGEEYV